MSPLIRPARSGKLNRRANAGGLAHPTTDMGEEMQYYKVFYTDKQLPPGAKPDFSTMMPLSFATTEEALKKSFKLIYGGATVWKIEGPNNFYLDRAQIERQYWKFRSG